MRQRFLKEFDTFWFDSMNGDSRETGKLTPEGKPDPSVFSTEYNREGIRVGTAIGLMVRKAKRENQPTVRYREFWGVTKREDLVNSLNSPDIDTDYSLVEPLIANRYSFRYGNSRSGYLDWPKLVDLCAEPPSNGLMEKRGGALLGFTQNELEKRMRMYYDHAVAWEDLKLLQTGLTEDAARFDAKNARSKVLATEEFQPDHLRKYALRPFDNRWCYYSAVRPLWNEPRPSLWAQCWHGNSSLLTRFQRSKDPEGSPYYFTRELSDDHFLSPDAVAIPFRLKASIKAKSGASQISLFGEELQIRANLSPKAIDYLRIMGYDKDRILIDMDNGLCLYELVWLHGLAIGYSPTYLTENTDGIRQDWPRIPLPANHEALVTSARLGKNVAALLDIEVPLAGVSSGSIRSDLKPIGVLAKTDGASIHPEAGDLAVEAGWGHAGKEGVIMPGRGKIVERVPLPGEWNGSKTLDVYLNEQVYWRNIPVEVWDYTIGGYQVIKKWLSYREKSVLRRDLLVEEARYVTEMARRIAALVEMQSDLDENYRRVTENVYQWH